MAKLPSFQFYPGDWMKDPELCRCSQAARGVWMDMLCLMFECEERGVLASNGEAWTDEEVACGLRGNHTVNLHCIQELLVKGVARRREGDGAISSSRMVQDELERQRWREVKQKARLGTITQCPEKVPRMSRRSSSSSSTSVKQKSKKISVANQKVCTPAEKKNRKTNPLWDALEAFFYPSGIAPGQRKHVGALVRDFKAKGATPDEIHKRADRYKRAWPDFACTPNSLLEHWDEFAEEKPRSKEKRRPGRIEAAPGKYDRF